MQTLAEVRAIPSPAILGFLALISNMVRAIEFPKIPDKFEDVLMRIKSVSGLWLRVGLLGGGSEREKGLDCRCCKVM